MRCFLHLKAGIILSTFSLLIIQKTWSQELIPVSLEEKVASSIVIALGTIGQQQAYTGPGGNIYTLQRITVTASIKMPLPAEIYVSTPGGVLNNRATVVNPSIQLEQGKEYLFFLDKRNLQLEGKNSQVQPLRHYEIFAYPQGIVPNENNYYKELLTPGKPERELFREIEQLSGDKWRTPAAQIFSARAVNASTSKPLAITGFSPNPTKAGTINPTDYLTINGVGFGPTPGTVAFPNADDGGASMITPPQTSDYVSWSDMQIVVKVPTKAGTGTFSVNGSFSSPSPLTVSYSLIDIYSAFLNFPVSTRQLPHLVNKNGLGGYTFLYNTTSGFASNAPAVASFERALVTWRTSTSVNFRTGGTTTATVSNDGINTILFGSTGGALAVTTTNYQGSGIPGSCEQQNTVWWIDDIDIMFANPPTATTTWQFGPALPSATQYDFESVSLHELGHAHNLGHVIAFGQVMHYAIANGATARTLSANDIAAGNEMMAWSSSLCFIPAGIVGPMTPASANLPVKFVSFTGRKKGQSTNLLTWTTAHEENNKGYFIQRSLDGKDFNDLGFIEGSNLPAATYNFEDDRAGYRSWYYRLLQVDVDGRVSYSPILQIRYTASGATVWTDGRKIFIQSQASQNSSICLFTGDGKLLLAEKLHTSLTVIELPPNARGVLIYRITGDTWHSGKILAQ